MTAAKVEAAIIDLTKGLERAAANIENLEVGLSNLHSHFRETRRSP